MEPLQQHGAKLLCVSDLFLLGRATNEVPRSLLHWLDYVYVAGFGNMGVCGLSMGGAHACCNGWILASDAHCHILPLWHSDRVAKRCLWSRRRTPRRGRSPVVRPLSTTWSAAAVVAREDAQGLAFVVSVAESPSRIDFGKSYLATAE
ncbi:protein ABHD18-like [Salvia divinorum]|uniref:Protein ABHD18-like n=1 Tax=Salvia divinorum TaxID=28513 RepID=A0ABD1IKX4_SALDI